MAQFVYTMNRVGKVVPAQARNSERYLPVFLPWRQDWRSWFEWSR